MPTQEDINAANVELEIANDNYAALANKYNRYRQTFEAYANATPEQQQKAGGIIKDALNQYEQLRLDMYAAEDRIQQAQNRVNDINAAIAAVPTGGTRRRPVIVPEVVVEAETVQPELPEQVVNIQNKLPNNQIQTSSYTPSWINSGATMTAASSRFPTPQTIAERQGTWNSRWSTYPSGLKTKIGYYTPDYTPAEIQRVRGLRGSDYVQGMKDLEKYRGYDVFSQNAYKNGNKWTLN